LSTTKAVRQLSLVIESFYMSSLDCNEEYVCDFENLSKFRLLCYLLGQQYSNKLFKARVTAPSETTTQILKKMGWKRVSSGCDGAFEMLAIPSDTWLTQGQGKSNGISADEILSEALGSAFSSDLTLRLRAID